jgi:uncharacterized protein (AIM24 family)
MKYDILDMKEGPYGKIEVIQAKSLAGSSDARSAESLFFVSQAGMRLKKVRITLPSKGSKARVEPGALYFMHGDLEMKASTGGGLMRGLLRSATTGESLFVNEIHGQGEIYLEPTFGHFILVDLTDDEIIVDKSLFYAALGDIDVSASVNRAVAGIAGGEGFFQTKISGTGVAVIFSPVPMDEVQEFDLNNSKLSVDGNFALMRTAGVDFSVEKSSKSWIATSVSGEGLLQTFKGSGKVWIAPTQGVYDKLATPGGLNELAGPPGARSTNTTS